MAKGIVAENLDEEHKKTPVFIASENIEKENQDLLHAMRVLKDVEQGSVNKAIKQVISQGSHLRSDGSANL